MYLKFKNLLIYVIAYENIQNNFQIFLIKNIKSVNIYIFQVPTFNISYHIVI